MTRDVVNTLTEDELESILSGLERLAGEFRCPVVIVDRVNAPGRCEVYEREDVERSFSRDLVDPARLMRLIPPAEWPFVRVLLLTATEATSLRIARNFMGVGAMGIS